MDAVHTLRRNEVQCRVYQVVRRSQSLAKDVNDVSEASGRVNTDTHKDEGKDAEQSGA